MFYFLGFKLLSSLQYVLEICLLSFHDSFIHFPTYCDSNTLFPYLIFSFTLTLTILLILQFAFISSLCRCFIIAIIIITNSLVSEYIFYDFTIWKVLVVYSTLSHLKQIAS